MMVSVFLIILVASACVQGSDWLSDPKKRALSESKRQVSVKEFTLNLDLPQEERWKEIGETYKDRAWQLTKYLRDNLPDGWLEPLEKLATKLLPFFADYGGEMQGYADALGLSSGDIVMVNLVYQLEHLGIGCGMANTTGPVNIPFCNKAQGVGYATLQYPEEDDLSERDGPDMCTSFVSSTPSGDIWHGRNLDWNLQDTLKEFIINVDYSRGGKTVFKGTTIVGFVGILHAVKENGFAWSMDARRKGGSIPFNVLEAALSAGSRTPEQHARYVFESDDVTKYTDAVTALSDHNIVNPAYFIVSGTKYPEGTVIARGREGVAKKWDMGSDSPPLGEQSWYTAVTNYDLDHQPPPSDDRTTPLIENLNALKGQDYGETEVWDILKTWPTFNMHTDITMVAVPKEGFFNVVIWMDH
jgi:hypothetical protein